MTGFLCYPLCSSIFDIIKIQNSQNRKENPGFSDPDWLCLSLFQHCLDTGCDLFRCCNRHCSGLFFSRFYRTAGLFLFTRKLGMEESCITLPLSIRVRPGFKNNRFGSLAEERTGDYKCDFLWIVIRLLQLIGSSYLPARSQSLDRPILYFFVRCCILTYYQSPLSIDFIPATANAFADFLQLRTQWRGFILGH